MSHFPDELPEGQPLAETHALPLSEPPAPPDALARPPYAEALFSPAHERPQPERIPNFGHLGILLLLMLLGLLSAGLLAHIGITFHLFGVSTVQQAATDIHYTLGTEGLFYLFAFAASCLLFPHLWGRGFFAGLQWNAWIAWRSRGYLFGAALACFVLALFNGWLMPGPADAPIDKIFRMPGAAWALFIFGVTFAPFFEELAFRGFLLPALATAFDWAAERSTGRLPHALDSDGHPQWSMPAMIAASLISSLLFALLHAEQTGTTLHSLGPFLLLCCVSLVLCGVRLLLRSLAASVLVHATYNFLLFSLMFLGTGGFRHLDNM